VARSADPLYRVLTFGGQVPPAVGSLLVAMLLATVAGTVAPELARLLVLEVPSLDGSGWIALVEAWRLVTWPFFQGQLPGSLLTVLFAGFMLVWLGRQLSFAWSERRFLVRFFLITVGAALVTLLVLTPFGYPLGFFGLWPIANALLVTWGLIFPGQRLSWFGALEMSGATVAKAIAIGTPIWALVVGPQGLGLVGRLAVYLPHMAAILVAWLLVADGPRRRWYRVKSWWAQRRLAEQRRRFKVVTTDRPPPKQWMN
jgi:hypothetical protein